ncbi:FbpB family small basic protein [Bacillus suaedaesalsae]|uniref:FbpB family small basic protein n=1 Tax=Bacillus suaedaesalsae TaxID=2810349 RepID=A0ABS2DM97_9BACI|nr:FbpB family small basic protein [Bacillus suaedaesalsae]MBM6619185.1 FbpB family small basic protein [Bacillus suaedaesalsae]
MRKVKLTLSQLMKKNKEELLHDKLQIEKIEKRVEEKISNNSEKHAV